MANAKTYNELNQTSAVNASDLVAVAQSDKTELQATTVSDLANTVGELNQAGALAELSLATSIGKNLLAQRLNEKGVENITPNSTLVEMADAVNDLQTTESSQILTSKFFLDVVNTPSKGSLGYSLFAWCKLPQGNTAVVVSDTIYIFKTQSDYNSLADAIDKAIMSLPLTTIPTDSYGRLYMTSSQDGKTLLVRGVATNDKTDIYDVNYETNTITYIRTLELTSYSPNFTSMAISNDKKLISLFVDWDHTYRIYNVDDITKFADVSLRPDGMSVGFASDNRTLFMAGNIYATSSGYSSIAKILCTVSDEGAVTATIQENLQYPSGGGVYFDKLNMLLLKGTYSIIDNVYRDTGSNYALGVGKVTISLADLNKDAIDFIDVCTTTILSCDAPYISYAIDAYLLGIIDIIQTGDTLRIKLLYSTTEFTYNRITGEFVVTTSEYRSPYEQFKAYSTEMNSQVALYYKAPNEKLCIAPTSEYISSTFTQYSGAYLYTIGSISDEKLAGFKWTINGIDSYFLRGNMSKADITSGKFDLTTKQVEIPADN